MRSPVIDLSPRAFKTLERIGDIYCPGDETFPSFSQCGCAHHADHIFTYLPEKDKKDLTKLLSLLSFFPTVFLHILIWILEHAPDWENPIGTLLRQLRLALRGICFSLYYSGLKQTQYRGATPLERLSYHVQVLPLPTEKHEQKIHTRD